MQKTEKKPALWKIILLAVLLAAMMLLLDWMHLRNTAKSRYTDLNSAARTVFLAAESYRADGHAAEEFAGTGRLTGQAGGFAAYLLDADNALQPGSRYAIVCDESGKISYVLYACGHIPEKYLTAPPAAGDGEDRDSMLRLLQTPVLWRQAVGVYYPAVISAAPASEKTSETK
ncbi:MAG: hypothetical protein IKN55_00240 [Oscillospiraceae bacterium]|nr:hypothetical protein [Oscillospiraceae bacterium]